MEQMTTLTRSGIDALHPDGQYSRGAKWFHWLTVPSLGIILLSGLTIRFMNDDVKMSFYTLHESLGLLVLLLSIGSPGLAVDRTHHRRWRRTCPWRSEWAPARCTACCMSD